MTRRRRRTSLLVAVALFASACVMPDDISRIERDINDVQQSMLRLRNDGDTTTQRLDELTALERTPDAEPATRMDLAELALRMDQLSRQVSLVDERMNDVSRRLDRYSQDLAQTRQQSRWSGATLAPGGDGGNSPNSEQRVGPVASAPDALPDPEALYNTSYADFSKGNFALAISGFGEYQERFPDSALADNALYWVAECRFSQGDYSGAVEALDRLLTTYPSSDKAAAADLKKALAYLEQNQVGRAIVQLRYVVSRHPETDEARLSEEKLQSLGATPDDSRGGA